MFHFDLFHMSYDQLQQWKEVALFMIWPRGMRSRRSLFRLVFHPRLERAVFAKNDNLTWELDLFFIHIKGYG
jgi:hypothetical protein